MAVCPAASHNFDKTIFTIVGYYSENLHLYARQLGNILKRAIRLAARKITVESLAAVLVGFIRFQLSAHGGQLYKRIS